MLPRFRFAQLLWFVLLICTFLTFGGNHAEAEEALASWYGPGFEGHPMASGAPYDPNAYTAASRTLPLGTKLLVSYGGRTVPVTVTDWGHYIGNRELDLSEAAARELGFTRVGVDYVDWRYADPSISQGVAPQEQSLLQVAQEPAGLPPAGVEPNYPNGNYGAESSGYPRSHPPALDEANSGTYVVQPGDTLSQIATQLGISVDDLARYNGIADPNLIYSGQALYLPLEAPVGTGGDPTTADTANQSSLGMGDSVTTGEDFVASPTSGNGELQVPDGTAVPDYGTIGVEGNLGAAPSG